MVTRFVTSPPTDNCPQPKEALPAVSTSTLPYYICLNPRLCSMMVRKWSTVPISLSYTTPACTVVKMGLLHAAPLLRLYSLQSAGAAPVVRFSLS